MASKFTTLEIRSKVTAEGELELALVEAELPSPAAEEIIVRIEASPINPSDLALLFPSADFSTMRGGGTRDRPILRLNLHEGGLGALKARLDISMATGNEGAGTVVDAGKDAEHLLGKKVGMWGGGMYSRFRKMKADDVIILPEECSAADGASLFINPLTALGFVETMKQQGHEAIIHLPAASNLGQMLNRICLADGIPLVNIVRNPSQVALLKSQGAQIVLDSSSPNFEVDLVAALDKTGATLAFDAIGGGDQASRLLRAMESVASRKLEAFSRYGSSKFKQVYVYGALDLSPTIFNHWVGFAWSVGGWLLTDFMAAAGPVTMERLRKRVVDEINTTFVSHYHATISLAEALAPDIVARYIRRATGEKYLINPSA